MTFDCTKINLKKGSKGEQVKELQTILKNKGLYTRQVDGDFGTYTETAVKQLQKQQGNDPDGWFGQKTCQKLQQKTTPSKTDTEIINNLDVIGALQKATGVKITDHKTLYNAYKKCNYKLYYNDIYTLKEEITRILNKQTLNCTDFAQSARKALTDLKDPAVQDVQIVRGVVNCNSGKGYGHVWLRIKTGGKWINYDPSAAAAHGYNMGNLICTRGYYITNINPGWAVSDDGKT